MPTSRKADASGWKLQMSCSTPSARDRLSHASQPMVVCSPYQPMVVGVLGRARSLPGRNTELDSLRMLDRNGVVLAGRCLSVNCTKTWRSDE
jgi:hypothetical protein